MTSALLLPNFSVTGLCKQNHRVLQFGRDFWRPCSSTICSGQLAQGHVQSSLEHLQQWRSHNVFGQTFAVSLGMLSMGAKVCLNMMLFLISVLYCLVGDYNRLLGPLPKSVCLSLLCGSMRQVAPSSSGFSPRISF